MARWAALVRAKGQSLGSSSHWLMDAIISLTFSVAGALVGGVPVCIFWAMMVLQFIVVSLVYPETKQVSLEQMQQRLGIE